MNVEQIGFKSLSEIVVFKKNDYALEGKVYSDPQKGVIIGIKAFSGKPDKDTFVQFRPDGSREAKTFRLSAFADLDIIILVIEDQITLTPQQQGKIIAAITPPSISIEDARNISGLTRTSPTIKSQAIRRVQAEKKLMQVLAQIYA